MFTRQADFLGHRNLVMKPQYINEGGATPSGTPPSRAAGGLLGSWRGYLAAVGATAIDSAIIFPFDSR